MNAVVYSLKFFLKNISNTRIYRVLEEEQNRLNEVLQNRNQTNNTSFFSFDTVDGLSVCISIKDIQAVQMLFDIGSLNTSLNNPNFDKSLSLFLRGWSEEFPIDIEDEKEIYNLIFSLDSVSDDNNEFLQLTDCDGELNLLNIREIVWLEVGTNIVNEGQRMSNEEEI